MKQFVYIGARGQVSRPLTLADAKAQFVGDPHVLDSVGFGYSVVDRIGFTFVRIPDWTDDSSNAAAADRRVERLERIATAALQGIMAAPAQCPMSPKAIASCAVLHAKALIAELDKQA